MVSYNIYCEFDQLVKTLESGCRCHGDLINMLCSVIDKNELKEYICSPTRYTKFFLTIEFYSSYMLARHVSDLTGPSSGTFFTSCNRRLWYVVILVDTGHDTASHYSWW